MFESGHKSRAETPDRANATMPSVDTLAVPITLPTNTTGLASNLGAIKPELTRLVPPPAATTDQLIRALDNAWASITRGGNSISKAEARFIVELSKIASSRDDGERFFKDLRSKMVGVEVSPGAKSVGFDVWMGALPGQRDHIDTDPTRPPPVLPPTDPLPPATLPPAPVPAAWSSFLARLPVEPASVLNPLKVAGDATFVGPYRLTARALDRLGLAGQPELFGSTVIQPPAGDKYRVHDMLYDLGNGKIGMKLVPIDHRTRATVKAPDGRQLSAFEPLDRLLRSESGLTEHDQLFAFHNFFHPEDSQGTLQQILSNNYKTQQAYSHTACYWGGGVTRNSPTSLNGPLDVGHVPAHLMIMSLDGVDQRTLSRNGWLVSGQLNMGVNFASDYTNDNVICSDINTTLMLYRDKLLGKAYLNEPRWKQYCSEHQTINANIMCNLPHNEASFKEVFGNRDGAAAWAKFKTDFARSHDKPWKPEYETRFEPLYKKEGLTVDQIKPWGGVDDFYRYDESRRAGTLDAYTGARPLKSGQAMVWASEHTVDLVQSFVESYASVRNVGGAVSAMVMMNFRDKARDRIGASNEEFNNFAVQAMGQVMICDAHLKVAAGIATDVPTLLARARAELTQTLAAFPDVAARIDQILEPLKAKAADVVRTPVAPAAAYAQLEKNLEPIVAASRVVVKDRDLAEYNSGPAIFDRVAKGAHPKNPLITLKTVATAVHADNLELKS